ncbi:sulfate adenylyltransferase subunit 1 [Jonesia denitrificans]|uniref:sulfate adenylyltransferase n=1 Tax=Jonesia denitrificans (strain ATCC 14870 / DSM 20603 / BCRC 15368 / CIP 55.134 / JCM 11481 / NBRC 15587 / NCTC 10816 / Prevot 55134) TaxID=471856 RepID=C7R1A8_JONDD|nr:GTP-binding protein [Jonesia denitrificans]ACV08323.1 sulfate adenylyltransferase, large subunit [Jonesia denitrificans DSM 20603]ASE08013.1 sulfate adenylyltransferase [Jonesia denitrificans]QXB42622.1 50S ribosome-binding GTPase [Jonesia denitrificans]SQH20303.1 Bifunctional enzyme CysN/CysC [Jonesia denitrificans]
MSTLLRLATAGSVDDGKSTLVGRLLYDSKSVLVDQLESVERVSRDRGLEHADLALLTDGLRAEREQGITIDVAYRYFATAKRTFILADCPGHVQYTRNTVTGASTAHVVVLLLDARKGLVEQTRRHLAVASLLRVPHVVVAVNKIDLVGYSQDRYDELDAEVRAVAAELGVEGISTIPVSALVGDNIVDRSVHTPWYEGPSLLELLEELPGDPTPEEGSFRFPVQTVIRPQGAAAPQFVDYRGYAGQVAQGVVRVGDAVTVLPSGATSTIIGIDTFDGPLEEAFAPQSVTLRLSHDLDVTRGDLLSSSHDAPNPTRTIHGTLAWLAERPAVPGARVLIKHTTHVVQGVLRDIHSRLNLDTAHHEPADSLTLNDIGHVTLRVAADLAVEDYLDSRHIGSFLVIDPASGYTLAAGMVGDALEAKIDPASRPSQYSI